jgi:hypothetical protein
VVIWPENADEDADKDANTNADPDPDEDGDKDGVVVAASATPEQAHGGDTSASMYPPGMQFDLVEEEKGWARGETGEKYKDKYGRGEVTDVGNM